MGLCRPTALLQLHIGSAWVMGVQQQPTSQWLSVLRADCSWWDTRRWSLYVPLFCSCHCAGVCDWRSCWTFLNSWCALAFEILFFKYPLCVACAMSFLLSWELFILYCDSQAQGRKEHKRLSRRSSTRYEQCCLCPLPFYLAINCVSHCPHSFSWRTWFWGCMMCVCLFTRTWR